MNTLFDKIWDAHTVKVLDGGSCVLYIDRQYIHEVTSPQAFAGLRERGIGVFRPSQVTASPDHNIPPSTSICPSPSRSRPRRWRRSAATATRTG